MTRKQISLTLLAASVGLTIGLAGCRQKTEYRRVRVHTRDVDHGIEDPQSEQAQKSEYEFVSPGRMVVDP